MAGRWPTCTFEPPDLERFFPVCGWAYEAAEAGGAHPISLNASDEVAVAAFLEGPYLVHGYPAYNRGSSGSDPGQPPR